jgi:DNA modification methylase
VTRAKVPTTRILCGDALELAAQLEPHSVDAMCTSPPYFRARDYEGHPNDLGGTDQSLDDYVCGLVNIFGAIAPALTDHAAVWLNIADRFAQGGFGLPGPGLRERPAWDGMVGAGRVQRAPDGYHDRDLVPVGELVIAALRRELGWVHRLAIVWSKSVATEAPRRDRPSRSHEMVHLLTPRPPCRASDPHEGWWGSVWTIRPASSVRAGHPAPMPAELARRCLVASDHPRLALDPFAGSGTTLAVARQLGIPCVGFELNAAYVASAERRIHNAPVRDSRVCTHCGEPIDDRTNRIGCGRQKCTQWRYRQRLKARRHKVTCHEIKAEQGGPPRHRETPTRTCSSGRQRTRPTANPTRRTNPMDQQRFDSTPSKQVRTSGPTASCDFCAQPSRPPDVQRGGSSGTRVLHPSCAESEALAAIRDALPI